MKDPNYSADWKQRESFPSRGSELGTTDDR